MTPADQMHAAAAALRNLTRHPQLAQATDLPYTEPLADWLDHSAASLAATTHPAWQDCVAPHALAVARAILGDQP